MAEHVTITCRSMLKQVPIRWWTEFKRFVEEGNASAEFLDFYESHEACQKAFELILRDDPVMKVFAATLKSMGEPDLDQEIN